MFNVNTANIKVDFLLTNIVVKFRDNMFTGTSLLPEVVVAKESNKFRIFKKDGFFKFAPKKADGAVTEEATLSFDEGTYQTFERALKDLVTDRAIQNADSPVSPLADTSNFLAQKIQLAQEVDVFTTALANLDAAAATKKLLTSGTTGSTNWKEGADATILKDISAAINAIVLAIGKRPNQMYFNEDTMNVVADNADITEILKHTADANITAAVPVPILRGLRVQPTDAVYNTAAEGQTAVFRNVLFDDTENQSVIINFTASGDPLTYGVTFVSRQFLAQRWRDLDREGEFVKVSKIYTPKVLNTEAGFVIQNILGNK